LFEELLRDIQDEEKDLFMNEVKERIREIKGSFSEYWEKWFQTNKILKTINVSLIDPNEEMRIKDLRTNIEDEFSRYDSVFDLFDKFEGGLLRAVGDPELDNFSLAKFNSSILEELENIDGKSRDTNIYRRLSVRVQQWKDKSRIWELMLQQKVKTQDNWDELLKMVGRLK